MIRNKEKEQKQKYQEKSKPQLIMKPFLMKVHFIEVRNLVCSFIIENLKVEEQKGKELFTKSIVVLNPHMKNQFEIV